MKFKEWRACWKRVSNKRYVPLNQMKRTAWVETEVQQEAVGMGRVRVEVNKNKTSYYVYMTMS